MFEKPIRAQDKDLLARIRSQQCCINQQCQGPVDASHIKTRGSGGPDTPWNVVSHCRKHHVEWGQYGVTKFIQKYPQMAVKLKIIGWSWLGGKLTHPKLTVLLSPSQGSESVQVLEVLPSQSPPPSESSPARSPSPVARTAPLKKPRTRGTRRKRDPALSSPR